MIAADRLFFERLATYINEKQDFIVETTLSGSYINKVASKAIKRGYEVKIIYLFLDKPNLCIERVKSRVIKGGHDVPKEDIVRRFYRSKDNFWNKMIDLSSNWVLI